MVKSVSKTRLSKRSVPKSATPGQIEDESTPRSAAASSSKPRAVKQPAKVAKTPAAKVKSAATASKTASRTLIIVLGAHRSGTSALTRLLSMVGATLPRRLMGAGPGNPTGHWEPVRLVEYHDQLMSELDSSWYDWSPLDLKKLSVARRERVANDIAEIVAEDFGNSTLAVVKDPRISRFPGAFIEAVKSAGWSPVVVLAYRNPLDVVASLIKRDVFWPEGYDRTDAALIWLSHMLESEKAARELPRAIVSYEAVVADPVKALAGVVGELKIRAPKTVKELAGDITGFIDPAHRNHLHRPDDVLIDPDLSGWVADTYAALRDLEAGRNLNDAYETLDRVRNEFMAAMPLLKASASARLAAREEVRSARRQLEALGIERNAQIEQRDGKIAEIQKQIEAFGDQEKALRGQVDQTQAEYAALQQVHDETVAERDASTVAIAEFQKQIEEFGDQEKALRERIEQAQAEHAALQQVHDETVAERDASTVAIAEFQKQIEEFGDQEKALRGRIEQAQAEHAALQQVHDETVAEREASTVAIAEFQKQIEEFGDQEKALRGRIEQAQAEHAALQQVHDETVAERDASTVAIAEFQKQIEEFASREQDLRSQIDRVQADNAFLESANLRSVLELDLAASTTMEAKESERLATARYTQSQAEIEDLGRWGQELKIAAADAGAKLAIAEEQVLLELAENERLRTEVQRLEEKLAQAETSVAAGARASVGDVEGAVEVLSSRKDVDAFVLREALAEQTRVTELLSQREDELDVARQSLSDMMGELDQAHEAYRSSTSWKLTAPLRGIRTAAIQVLQLPRRSVRVVRKVYHAIRIAGGPFRALRKFGSVMRNEGFKGVRWRLNYAEQERVAYLEDGGPTPAHRGSNIASASQGRGLLRSKSGSRGGTLNVAATESSKDPEFVPRAESSFGLENSPVSVIAFYLPQYHPIPENDKWWGAGFTEWSNVARSRPQYEGHYQPHVPGELGYYDLRLAETFTAQVELAKLYGVNGFCFYFYWFGGQTLLEMPLEKYLGNKDLTLPFCLCWANENWTRRWDGMDSDVLMAQSHSPEDDINFISHLSKYLADERYIRIGGKPLVMIYRPNLLPNPRETAQRWRDWCRNNGLGEIYLAYTQSFERVDPAEYGFDAAVEFPPNNSNISNVTEIAKTNEGFAGQVYDWRDLVHRSDTYVDPGYKLFRGVNPGWDNAARKQERASILAHSSPSLFERWTKNAIRDALKNSKDPDDRIIFVNAWNEWAEGAHLEPDQKYGYGYLAALSRALASECADASIQAPLAQDRSNSVAVIVHCFYMDVFEEILQRLKGFPRQFHLYVTVPPDRAKSAREVLQKCGMTAKVIETQNRGRDVLPFLKAVRLARGYGHDLVLKLHTKKSVHRDDGHVWRNDMFDQLLEHENSERILSAYDADERLGLVGPDGHVVSMDTYIGSNRESIVELAGHMGLTSVKDIMRIPFVAGTMFYVRIAAIDRLVNLRLNDFDFDVEAGQIDGTLAHAVERAFGISCVLSGMQVASLASIRRGGAVSVNRAYGYAAPS